MTDHWPAATPFLRSQEDQPLPPLTPFMHRLPLFKGRALWLRQCVSLFKKPGFQSVCCPLPNNATSSQQCHCCQINRFTLFDKFTLYDYYSCIGHWYISAQMSLGSARFWAGIVSWKEWLSHGEVVKVITLILYWAGQLSGRRWRECTFLRVVIFVAQVQSDERVRGEWCDGRPLTLIQLPHWLILYI